MSGSTSWSDGAAHLAVAWWAQSRKGRIYWVYLKAAEFKWRDRYIKEYLALLQQNPIIRAFGPKMLKRMQSYDGLYVALVTPLD